MLWAAIALCVVLAGLVVSGRLYQLGWSDFQDQIRLQLIVSACRSRGLSARPARSGQGDDDVRLWVIHPLGDRPACQHLRHSGGDGAGVLQGLSGLAHAAGLSGLLEQVESDGRSGVDGRGAVLGVVPERATRLAAGAVHRQHGRVPASVRARSARAAGRQAERGLQAARARRHEAHHRRRLDAAGHDARRVVPGKRRASTAGDPPIDAIPVHGPARSIA